jgi:hypothetical protein
MAVNPLEAFARRAFRGGLGGIEGERRLLDFLADKSVAEVLRPALADGLRFRNSEILTVHDGKIVDVEVYFGWAIPHEAAEGGFVNPETA